MARFSFAAKMIYGVLTATTAGAAIARAQDSSAAPDLASVTANTVQVTVAHWGTRPAPVGQVPPLERIDKVHVAIDNAANRVHIDQFDITPWPADRPARAPSLFVSDGKTQYELLGPVNQYLKSEATPVRDGLNSKTGLTGPGLALALGWKGGDLDKFASAPDEPIEAGGAPLRLYIRKRPVLSDKDKQYQYTEKLWVDPATRLPVRHSFYVKVIGEAQPERELIRDEYSDWKLNATLAAGQFAWAPPAGAEPYKAPVRPVLLAAGAPAPDFTAEKWGGGDLKLSDYRGKVVVLDFWATWCGPCQMSMPHVEQIHRMTRGQDVVVLGVCVWDDKKAYEKWVPEHQDKYGFTFGYDPAGRGATSIAGKLYHVSGIPTTYVIGKDGKVAAAIQGFNPGGDTRLETALTALGIKVSTSVASR